MTPRCASLSTTQSNPGPRRLRVSQPSPMSAGRPGRIRLSGSLKNRSLAAHRTPPGVVGRPAAPPRLPSVHPLAAVGVLPFDEDAAPRLQQVGLGREEFVARLEGAPAQPRGGEVDQRRSHWPTGGEGKRPFSYTRTPRTNVSRTTPHSVCPAYGVTGCR